MITLLNLFGLAASLLISFISSGMETALYRVSLVRMRLAGEKGDGRAGRVLGLVGSIDSAVTAILIENNIAAYTGTYFLANQLAAWNVEHEALITTAIITPLFFVFTESLPKQLAYNNADRWALELARAFTVIRWSMSPLVWLLNSVSAVFRRVLGFGGEAGLGQSQRTLLLEHINAGVAEKVLTESQSRMAGRVMELEGIRAGASMIPVTALPRLAESDAQARAVAVLRRAGTELAVLVDGAGRLTGRVVTMKGLVFAGRPAEAVGRVAEELPTVAAAAALPEVLNMFRKEHTRRAVVTDRRRIVGVITSRSVLDRISGIV